MVSGPPSPTRLPSRALDSGQLHTAAPTVGHFTVVETKPGAERISEKVQLAERTLKSNAVVAAGSLSMSWTGSGTVAFAGGIKSQVSRR